MLEPGDIVTTEFMGVTGAKRRPCVVVSTTLYHKHRPDVILAIITTNLAAATAPTDYVLQDWASAGLNVPSAVRMYLGLYEQTEVTPIGRLSNRDWLEVQARLRLALAV